jgi:hypothetical protein
MRMEGDRLIIETSQVPASGVGDADAAVTGFPPSVIYLPIRSISNT